jgi:hypothetical protein
MTHAQKPDFVFRRNGRVHLNQQGHQFSRLLAAEVCASAVVMLDTPCSEVVWRVLATPTPFASFPFTSPHVRHRVPSHFNWTLLLYLITLSGTHVLGRATLDERSGRRGDPYLTTHNIQRRRTAMPPAGSEPAIPANQKPQTHALDLAPTGNGSTANCGFCVPT